jgi:hypothetical protein
VAGLANRAPDAQDRWDPLLVCVAGYILTAVARVHQLFATLELFHVAAITGLLAIARRVDGAQSARRWCWC